MMTIKVKTKVAITREDDDVDKSDEQDDYDNHDQDDLPS